MTDVQPPEFNFKLVYGVVRYLDLDCGRTNPIGKRSMKADTATQGTIGMPVERRCDSANFRSLSDITRRISARAMSQYKLVIYRLKGITFSLQQTKLTWLSQLS